MKRKLKEMIMAGGKWYKEGIQGLIKKSGLNKINPE